MVPNQQEKINLALSKKLKVAPIDWKHCTVNDKGCQGYEFF
jgi:hypothetical protein